MIIDDIYSKFHMSLHPYFMCCSCIFHMHLGLKFFLILICRKWPISAVYSVAGVMFFCDRDHAIVDCELQGP